MNTPTISTHDLIAAKDMVKRREAAVFAAQAVFDDFLAQQDNGSIDPDLHAKIKEARDLLHDACAARDEAIRVRDDIEVLLNAC